MIKNFTLTILLLLFHKLSFSQNSIEHRLSLKSEQSDCKIVKIEDLDNYNIVTVDFVVIKELYDDEDGHDNAIVINNNPKLRTYILPKKILMKHKETLDTCNICYWSIKTAEGKIKEMNWFIFQ